MSTPSIIFLIPYFGKWPFWFDYFLQSCRFNPSIDWQIYTDCPIPDNAPENVKFISISFRDYKQRISQKLGIDFNPDNPYKLCDMKPTYGYVHEQEIATYDFWGFSDIDLIYGDLRAYFTNERLNKKDFFSTHANRVSGHLCIMRNNKKMREAFMKIKNWRKRMSDNQHYALDEGAFSKIFIKRKNFPKPLFKLVGLLNPWRRNSEFIEAYSTPNAGVAWIDGSFNFPEKWIWNNGKLTNDLTGDREYPYFHFYGWKKDAWSNSSFIPPSKKKLLSWSVSQHGFAN